MTLTLYITNKRYSSWSLRPWLLLKVLGIPFKEELVIFKGGHANPQFTQFSPTGRVPFLHDEENSIKLWESLAICEYIAEKHPAAWPADAAARAFARSAASEMHAGFNETRTQLGMNVGLSIDIGPVNAPLQYDLDRFNSLFEEGLLRFGGPWLAGREFTIVDAFFAPIASRLHTYNIQLPGLSAQAYLDRLFEHPAVKQWVKEGIIEEARDPAHEEEATAGRKVLKVLAPENTG